MNKLAVFFPGIGYTVDKPLLHYSRRLARNLGYEIRLVPYSGFPEKKADDSLFMEESFRIALEQARTMLEDIDFSVYDEIILIGKSIGTAVAGRIAEDLPNPKRLRFVLYTPLASTFAYTFGDAIAFTGTKDPWVGKKRSCIPELCREQGIPCRQIAGGNHSLETGDVLADIRTLKKVISETQAFLEMTSDQQ